MPDRLQPQNFDINTVETLNGWHVHGLRRGLSASGILLPVGLPTTLGLYTLIRKDQPLLKDAIYMYKRRRSRRANLRYEALGRPDRPFVKYPDQIHTYSAFSADSPSFPSGHTTVAFSLTTSLSITYPKWYVIAPSALWACGVGCAFAIVYVNRWLNRWLFPAKEKRKAR